MPHRTAPPVVIRPPDDLLARHPHLRGQARHLSIAYRHRQVVTDDHLRLVGESLWRALDLDAQFDRAVEAAKPDILPLILQTCQPALQALPWETLHHPRLGFLGREKGFTLSRQWSAAPAVERPLPPGPLRVLLFSSLPEDLDAEKERLDRETEREALLEAFLPLIQDGLVQFESPDEGSFDDFKKFLNQRLGFHLVILSGHGRFQSRELEGLPGQSFFLFENDHGGSDPVEGAKIAAAFQGTGVRAVVLSACQSGHPEPNDLTTSLAGRLVELGLPYVIGMTESIFDQAGIRFARALCDALAARERIDLALQQARAAIGEGFVGGPPRQPEDHGATELTFGQWCLPALHARESRQELISWQFNPQPVSPTVPLTRSCSGMPIPTHYIGRKRQLREVHQLLAAPKTRRLLLTGVGGQGKTALAGTLALRLVRQGWHLVAWSARQPETWDGFITELKYGLDDTHRDTVDRRWADCKTPQDHAQLLLDALQDQSQGKLLVFLDNLETVQDAQGQVTHPRVAAWLDYFAALRALPQATGFPILLLTSRRMIPSLREQFHHYPLPRPTYGDFLRFTRELGLGRGEPKLWRRAYAALGGNFKGLQLFAGVRELGASEEDFLARLEATQEELNAYAAIREIVELLTPPQRALLTRLRAYETAVIEDGVKAIAPSPTDLSPASSSPPSPTDLSVAPSSPPSPPASGGEGRGEGGAPRSSVRPTTSANLPSPSDGVGSHSSTDPLPCLFRLVDLSLVEPGWNAGLGLTDYSLSPLLAEWLAQHDPPLPKEVRVRAAAYQLYVMRHLHPVIDQALVAHRALVRAEQFEPAHDLVLRILVRYFQLRGLNRALVNEWLPPLLRSQNTKTRAAALGSLGFSYHALGEYEKALAYMEKTLALRREIGDKQGEGTTLNNLSQIYDARGDYDTALDYLKQSLAISREIGDKQGEGTTLNNLSQIHKARGDYATALDYLKQSLAIQREIGDKKGEGATLNNLSTIAHARGDYDTALDYLKQSLAIRREIGDKKGESVTLNNISTIAQARGEYDVALEYSKQDLAICREIGDKQGEGTTLNNLSTIAHARGDYDTALDYLKQSLAIRREIGDKQGEGTTLNNLSAIAHARGDYATALDYLKQSLAIRREIGDKQGEGVTLNNLSQIYKARGDYATALDYLKQALAIRREIGDAAGLCTTLFNMGHLHAQKQDMPAAMSAWVQAYVLARKIGSAQALQALEGLAKHNGLPGLSFWEQLASKMGPANAPPAVE